MGEWDLTEELKNRVKPLVEQYINWIENYSNGEGQEELKLSHTGINPIQMRDLLKELGYDEKDLVTNGWEHDYWWYYTHPDKKGRCKKLIVAGCAMCHSINLSYDYK